MADTIRAALAGLKTRLETITAPARPRVYADPREAVSLAEFPCIVLGLSPTVQHVVTRKSHGAALNRPALALWLFVGSRQTPLPELHSRVLDWPDAIVDAILADQRLGNSVAGIGDGNVPGEVIRYQPGFIAWADGEYFGITFNLSVLLVRTVTMA